MLRYKVTDSEPPDEHTFSQKGAMRPLKVLHLEADEGLDATEFYETFGSEPLIVRGLYTQQPCLQNLNRELVANRMGSQKIWGWSRKTGKGDYIPASDIFADLRLPLSERSWNVVDHPVSVDTFGEPIEVPQFLRENWFLGSGFDTEFYRLNITISGADNWTPLHTDNNGMQGWMWLAYGKKEWQLFDPEQAQLLYDPVFKLFLDERRGNPAFSNAAYGSKTSNADSGHAELSHGSWSSGRAAGRWPHAHLAKGLQGVMQGGDLLWFPPGWAHQVYTPEESFGIGGSVFNHYLIEEAVMSMVTDRGNFFESELKIREFIEKVSSQPHRLPASTDPRFRAAKARVDRSLKLLEAFDRRFDSIVKGDGAW